MPDMEIKTNITEDAEKDSNSLKEQRAKEDLHPVRMERGIAPSAKGIEKSADNVIEVSEKEANVLVSLEGYGKAPNKENLEHFMIDLKTLMQDYMAVGLTEMQAAQKAHSFLSEQIGRAEAIGVNPQIITNLKNIEQASHQFFMRRQAESNAQARLNPSAEAQDYTAYEEVSRNETNQETPDKTADNVSAQQPDPVSAENQETPDKTADNVSAQQPDPVSAENIDTPEDNFAEEENNRTNNPAEEEHLENTITCGSNENVDENVDENGIEATPFSKEDADNLKYWLRYFTKEGERMDPPEASPFAQINNVKRSSFSDKTTMATSTGNNILATKHQLALDVKKDPGKPTFEDCMTMVLAARQRGWDTLEISGSPEFQKQMYLACRALGMPVKDFQPTPEMQTEAENIDKRFNPKNGPTLADCCDDLDRRFPQLEKLQASLPVPEMTKKERKEFDPREPRTETLEKAKEMGLGPCPRPQPEDTLHDLQEQLQELQEQLQESKQQAQTPAQQQQKPAQQQQESAQQQKPVQQQQKPLQQQQESAQQQQKPSQQQESAQQQQKPLQQQQESAQQQQKPSQQQESAQQQQNPSQQQQASVSQKALPGKTQDEQVQQSSRALPGKTQNEQVQHSSRALPGKTEQHSKHQKTVKAENLPQGVSETGYAAVSALNKLKENEKNEDPDHCKLISAAIKMYHANAVSDALQLSSQKKDISVLSADEMLAKAREKVDNDLKKNPNGNIAKLLSNYNNAAEYKMRRNRQEYARQTGQKLREFDFKKLDSPKNKRPENTAVASKKNDGYSH